MGKPAVAAEPERKLDERIYDLHARRPRHGRHLADRQQGRAQRLHVDGAGLSGHTKTPPRCIVIAGPNGSGKTTFARDFLTDAGVVHFVNADLIAAGLSPMRPELAAVSAARVFLAELGRLASARADFAFESTLAGRSYLSRLTRWKAQGYRVEFVYLKLASPALALRRIASRVRLGGHDVPRGDVLRRFTRSWDNFIAAYRPLADEWVVLDNSGAQPRFLERGP